MSSLKHRCSRVTTFFAVLLFSAVSLAQSVPDIIDIGSGTMTLRPGGNLALPAPGSQSATITAITVNGIRLNSLGQEVDQEGFNFFSCQTTDAQSELNQLFKMVPSANYLVQGGCGISAFPVLSPTGFHTNIADATKAGVFVPTGTSTSPYRLVFNETSPATSFSYRQERFFDFFRVLDVKFPSGAGNLRCNVSFGTPLDRAMNALNGKPSKLLLFHITKLDNGFCRLERTIFNSGYLVRR